GVFGGQQLVGVGGGGVIQLQGLFHCYRLSGGECDIGFAYDNRVWTRNCTRPIEGRQVIGAVGSADRCCRPAVAFRNKGDRGTFDRLAVVGYLAADRHSSERVALAAAEGQQQDQKARSDLFHFAVSSKGHALAAIDGS